MQTPAMQGKHGADEPAEMAWATPLNVSQVLLPRFYLACLSFQSHSLFKRKKKNQATKLHQPSDLGQNYTGRTLCSIRASRLSGHGDKETLPSAHWTSLVNLQRQNGSPSAPLQRGI